MLVDLQVRVEDVKWCRNVAPRGFPNRSTFCATFSVQKEQGEFDKGFVTPEFIVELPATSRMIVWLITVEVKEDSSSDAKPSDLLKYKGFKSVVRTQGPSIASLKRQLSDWVKFCSSSLKQKVVKSWINRILNDFSLTEEQHKALPLEERRALWASHDWSSYHLAVRHCVDGAWLPPKTLEQLQNVCRLDRTSVLPVYWEQRGLEETPDISRNSPFLLESHNLWKRLGWSFCKPFAKETTLNFWSRYAGIYGQEILKKPQDFLVRKTEMANVGDVYFWPHWKPQWTAFYDKWQRGWGGERSDSILQSSNSRTLVSLSGSSDAFLYEWVSESPNRQEQTIVFTTNPERALALSSLNLYVVVIHLDGFFCDMGQAPSSLSSEPSQPQKPGTVRIQATHPIYVFFDKGENWTITHGHQALKTIEQRFNNPDIRIGVLFTKKQQTLIPWHNDASPRILALLLEQETPDVAYHTCRHSETTNPAIEHRLSQWKELEGILVADDIEPLKDKIYNFYVTKDNPLIVCERGKQIQMVRDAVYENTSNTKIFKRERVYLNDWDMFGRVVSFHGQQRGPRKPPSNCFSAGMVLSNKMDVAIKMGQKTVYFDLESLSVTKSGIITPALLEDHTGYVLFVLDDSWWIKMHHLKEFMQKLDPKRVFLIGSTRRMATLLS